MQKLQLKKLHPHHIIIFVTVLITHGLMLLMDGIYWDGWRHYTRHVENDFGKFRDEFFATGVPVEAYAQWAMHYFPNVIFGYRFVSLLAILLLGLMVYQIGIKTHFLSRSESLIVALLTITYPAVHVYHEFTLMFNISAYAFLMTAAYLSLQFDDAKGWKKWVLRIAALNLFFISFWISSLLVFYFGFLLVWIVYWCKQAQFHWRVAATKFVQYHLDFVLLPFLMWLFKEIFFPRTGGQEGYNKFLLGENLSHDTIRFFTVGIVGQSNDALSIFVDSPIIMLAIILGLIMIYPVLNRWFDQYYEPTENANYLLLFGIILLGLSIFPYVLVGRSPDLEGTKTRHAMLIALPLAIISLATFRKAFFDSTAAMKSAGIVLITVLILVFGIAYIGHYFSWQARWVKDHSVIVNLRKLDNAEEISVFWIDDRFETGPPELYRFSEWASLFKYTWGGNKRVGTYVDNPFNFSDKENNRRLSEEHYLDDFNPEGCQAILTIRRGPRPISFTDEVGLSVRYFLFKYLLPGQLDDYLSEVTSLNLRWIAAPAATECAPQNVLLEATNSQDGFAFDPQTSTVEHENRLDQIIKLERLVEDADVKVEFDQTIIGLLASKSADFDDVLENLEGSEVDSDLPKGQVEELGFDYTFYRNYTLAAKAQAISAAQ